MKKILSIVLALALALSVAGCGAAAPASSAPAESASSMTSVTDALPPAMVDRAGNQFVLPESIETVVSMAPSITQTLIGLGCADMIVATDTNSVGTEGLSEGLPAFDMMTPDAEQLAALAPDLVLVSGISMVDGANPFQPLVDMGVTFVTIPTAATIEDIFEDIAFIGQVMGRPDEAKLMLNTLQTELQEIADLGASIPEEERKSVYFEIACAPAAYSFGANTYMDEMITMVGGKNVLADQEGWLAVDPEVAVAADPEVILTNVNYIEEPVAEILGRDGWSQVKAVADQQVYYIDNMSSSLPNQNITVALRQMGQALYPDVFKQ